MKVFLLAISSFLLMTACKTKGKASLNAPKKVEMAKTPSLSGEIGKEVKGAYSPNTLIIMVDTLVGKEPLLQAIKDYGATLKYDYNLIPGVAIRIPEGKTLQESIAYFKQVRGVVSVSKDRITRLTDPVKPKMLDK